MALHIGKEIERKYQESGIKLSEFAKRLNTSPRNIYDIFERSEIKTDQLVKICKVLNFNFFYLYQSSININEPDAGYSTKQKNSTVAIIVELDGQENTLNQTIQRLTTINKALV